MPSRLLIKISPGGTLSIVEDGRIDLKSLGRVVSRRRFGRIEPCPSDPSSLELIVEGEVVGTYTLKPDAVKAEVSMARDYLTSTALVEATPSPTEDIDEEEEEEEEQPVEKRLPPLSAEARCPLCRWQLVPHVRLLSRPDGLRNTSLVEYLCACNRPQTTLNDKPLIVRKMS